MSEENEPVTLVVKPQEEEFKKTSLSRTVISLALFIALDYWIFKSWFAVLLLVTVIFIHEAGHFIAMKFFGYKGVNMTFVPFVGAYVSGTATNLSRRNKLIVLLAGPLPGIIIGSILLLLHQNNYNETFRQLSILFLLLNVFNLLPVFPLDGGQFFQTLFFNGSRIIQLIFLSISLCSLIYFFFNLNYAWTFLIIAVLVLLRIGQINLINRVRKKLDEEGIDYACTYDDLTDEEYWQIRNVVISESRLLSRKFSTETQSSDEQLIIKHIENVLVPAYKDDLTASNKIIFTLVWFAAFALPVLLWMHLKGYF
ncbi:site-2 protease family protein [Ferruginibacter sp.]